MSENLELWAVSGRFIDDHEETLYLVWGKSVADAEGKFKKILAETEKKMRSVALDEIDEADIFVFSRTKVGVMLDGIFCLERAITDDWSDSCMEARFPKPKI